MKRHRHNKLIDNALVCQKCGRTDVSRFIQEKQLWYVGTSKKMRCPDCADETGHASYCRECCPTEHGTKWAEEFVNDK